MSNIAFGSASGSVTPRCPVSAYETATRGLFVLFWAIRLLGGETMLVAKLVATLLAEAAALMASLIAARMVRRPGAVVDVAATARERASPAAAERLCDGAT